MMAHNLNTCHLFCNSLNGYLKTFLVQSVRTHWKFSGTQTIQQSSVINKLMNQNQSILNKLMENKPKIVSKGKPNRKEIDGTAVDKRFVTRRMSVLNKQLMQCISDVLSTEMIGNKIQELAVRITQVEVNHRCDSANIFWVSKNSETQRIAEELDQIKGKLHQHLMDRNLMHSVPWIQFVLDLKEDHCQEVERILQKCDFGPDFKPSDATLFETPYEKIGRPIELPKNKIKDKLDNNKNIYQFLKIKRPEDMEMDCLGLDYEFIINTVLANLNKSRAQHRSFNAVADPLPPPDWSALPNAPKPNDSEAFYNTDQRIDAMKRFLIENKKKKERLSREKKRRIVLEDMKISYHLNEAFDSYQLNDQELEEELRYDFESEQSPNETNEENN